MIALADQDSCLELSARKRDHHIFFDDKAAMREAGFGPPWNSRLAPPHLA